MTILATNQKITIPNFHGGKFTEKDGYLTDNARAFFNQLIDCLQYLLSTEGFHLPSILSNQLSQLKTPGTILYGADTHVAYVNLNGIFHQITTS